MVIEEMEQKVYGEIERIYEKCFCKKLKIEEIKDMGDIVGYLTKFYINTGAVPTMSFAIEGTQHDYFKYLPEELKRLRLPRTSFYIANFKFRDELYEEQKN